VVRDERVRSKRWAAGRAVPQGVRREDTPSHTPSPAGTMMQVSVSLSYFHKSTLKMYLI